MSDVATLVNLEGREDFYTRWRWSEGTVEPGFTAVLRVKNEARSLPWVLPGLFRSLSRVVLVDNGSDDGTPDLARRIAEENGATERIEVLEYPFSVARCGPEHLDTPAASVHSLTYFYNWSFSHVRTRYALKWDGDMVLTNQGEMIFRDLAWQLESCDTVINIPRFPLYVDTDRVAYLDSLLKNREPWGWPNKPGYSFGKGLEWELQLRPDDAAKLLLPEWLCFELKYLDSDEFDHWSAIEFDRSIRTRRKAREWEVYHALTKGEVPEGVVKVETDGDQHVIDVVRTTSVADWEARTAEARKDGYLW